VTVNSVTDTTATIGFSIDPGGADTTYTIAYGPTIAYGSITPAVDIGSTSGAQALSATITGLSPASTFHFDVVATNADAPGGVGGGDSAFTTLPQLTGVTGSLVTVRTTVLVVSCPTGATVDWGDGSAPSPADVTCVPFNADLKSFGMTASHIYSKAGHYPVAVSDASGIDRYDAFALINTATATTVVSSSNPSTTGDQVTYAATVTPTPDAGTVSFTDGGTAIAACQARPINAALGIASCQLTYAVAGSHTIVATYSGDASFAGSGSSALTQTVNAAGNGGPPPPLPSPVNGHEVNLIPVSGTVLVKLPGGKTFTRLTAGEQLPVGSTVDVTHGRVTLVSAKPDGGTETADFYGGVFVVGQQHGEALTTLKLTGGNFKSCSSHHAADRGGADAHIASRRPRRHLWGSGHGSFSTTGMSASATVRGTIWLTQDDCEGTLIRVRRGIVTVRDLVRHKTILVPAPHSYFAARKR
jgi:hypothetical protein